MNTTHTNASTFATANQALDLAERAWRKDDDEQVTLFLQIFADAATRLHTDGVDIKLIARRCGIGPRGARRSHTGPDVVARVDWHFGQLNSYTAELGDRIHRMPSKGWFQTVNQPQTG